MSDGTDAMKWKPRLRTVLLTVNVIVLLVPLAGIGLLRIYESELIRRTESELISQGALVQAAYKRALLEELRAGCGDGVSAAAYGSPVEVKWPVNVEDKFRPVPADLDLSSERPLGPPPPPRTPDQLAERCAAAVGDRLTPMLLDAQQITLSGIHVVDPRGTVVATTQDTLGRSLAHREEVARALDGEFVQLLRRRTSHADEPPPPLESIRRRSQVRVFVAMPVVHQGRVLGAVVLVRTPLSLVKAVYNNRAVFGSFLALVLLAVVIISLLTAFTIGRPIRALIAQTRRIARQDADATRPIEHPGTREFAELSEAFAEMAANLEQRAEYIQTFARNVSHEFKTPLSSIRGTVELLRDHLDEMEPAQRDRFLEMLDKDGARLERLVSRLLELARADMLEPGEVDARLGPVVEALAERCGEQGLAVEVALEPAVDRVALAPETLESVLSNLLQNALQHGATTADITAEQADGQVIIEVWDDGGGISEANARRIFDAFFTTNRGAGGTGLGLSITAALLEAHGGSIALVDRHTARFRIALPAA